MLHSKVSWNLALTAIKTVVVCAMKRPVFYALVLLILVALVVPSLAQLPPPPAPATPGPVAPGPAAPAAGPTAPPPPAQPGAPGFPPPAGQIAGVAPVWEDTKVLHLASVLQLSQTQAQQIAQVLDALQQQISQSKTVRRQLWQANWESISTVVNAWIADQQPDPQVKTQADTAAQQAQAQDDALAAAIDTAAAQVRSLLSDQQDGLIETMDDAEVREERMALFGGHASLADYVVAELDAQRSLMMDEYELIRVGAAAEVARKIVDPRSNDYPVVEDAVLRLFDQVNDVSDQDYAAARTGLADQIRTYLNLPPDDAALPVKYGEFIDWVKSPRTPKYLKIYGTVAQPLPAEAPAPEDELGKALKSAQIVSLINDLQFTVPQLRQLLSLATEAQTDRNTSETNEAQIIASATPPLTTLLGTLIAARPMDEQAAWFLSDTERKLQENEDELTQVMIEHVDAAARIMTPAQAQYVDWRVPPAVVAARSAKNRAEERVRQSEVMRDAVEFVDSIRNINRTWFFRARYDKVGEFLEEYIQPGTQEFLDAQEGIVQEITSVFRMATEKWEPIKPAVMTRILEHMGQFRETTWEPSDLPLDWYAIQDVLLSAETSSALDQMLRPAATTAPVGTQ